MAISASSVLKFYSLFDDDLEEEDDDSADEILLFISVMNLNMERRMRAQNFAETAVNKMSDFEFRKHYRLEKSTFYSILSKLENSLLPKGPGGYDIVVPEKQLLIFLTYLSNQDSMREIALLYGITDSTVHKIITKVSREISSQRTIFIQWPNQERRTEIKEEFRRMSGISGIVGAIDGTHIRILNLPGASSDYYNRKGFPSVQLQLVVDDMLLINSINVGWPGSAHDARVLRNSEFYLRANNGVLFGKGEFVLGDSAYPLKPYLITVFKDNGHLSRKQRKLNRLISSCRQVVERSIGRLKGRFRRLREIYSKDVRQVCSIITAACALHNMCILAHDDVQIFIENDDETNGFVNVYRNDNSASEFRNQLLDNLED